MGAFQAVADVDTAASLPTVNLLPMYSRALSVALPLPMPFMSVFTPVMCPVLGAPNENPLGIRAVLEEGLRGSAANSAGGDTGPT